MKKILVIRFSPLRNFAHAVDAMAAIRKFHSKDEITILTEKSLIKFCKRSGFFDKVWLDSKPEWFNFSAILDLRKRLISSKFDLVYDLQNSKRSLWYYKLWGFKKPKFNSSVIEWCDYSYSIQNTDSHYQDVINNQVKVVGIKSVPYTNIAYVATNDIQDLPENFIMVCAGGNKEKKAHKWHPQKYAKLLDILYENYGLQAVLVGDAYDDILINAAVATNCTTYKPLNISGKTSITGIIGVALKAQFCFGNETSPLHLSAYAGCKTVMLCSRYSLPESIAPRLKNIAFIEEAFLENVDVERVLESFKNLGLIK
jgi:ADP-heptose:LPS heptosyltransferase